MGPCCLLSFPLIMLSLLSCPYYTLLLSFLKYTSILSPLHSLSPCYSFRCSHLLLRPPAMSPPLKIHFPVVCFPSALCLSFLIVNRFACLLLLILSSLILSPGPHPSLTVGSSRAGTVPVSLTTVSLNAWHIVSACGHLLKE